MKGYFLHQRSRTEIIYQLISKFSDRFSEKWASMVNVINETWRNEILCEECYRQSMVINKKWRNEILCEEC